MLKFGLRPKPKTELTG